MNNKGQVLVIMALVVVLVMFLVRTEVSNINSYEFSESNFVNSFMNIKNEFKKSGQITIWKNNYTVLNDFSSFLKERKDIEVFYSIVDYEDSGLNMTFVNFLEEDIQEIQVSQNLTGSDDSITSISSGSSDFVNFTTGSYSNDEPFQVNISYVGSVSGTAYNHSFVSYAGNGRRVTVFYDLVLNYYNSFVRDKFTVFGSIS